MLNTTMLEMESSMMLDNLESEQLIDTLTEPLPDIPYRPKMISLDDDVTATFAELVTTYGYFSTEHTVTTSDGYVLTVWRVNKTATPSGNPVFIQHGLFGDGVVWTLNKQKSLAFVLANAGYDVWIGNNRGNQFSRTNINLDIVTQAK
jgi:pimeloyl-ACP methyl ester carboxylesterase